MVLRAVVLFYALDKRQNGQLRREDAQRIKQRLAAVKPLCVLLGCRWGEEVEMV